MKTSRPLACPIEGCDFVALTKTGLNTHDKAHARRDAIEPGKGNQESAAEMRVPGYLIRDPKAALKRHIARNHEKVFGVDCLYTPCTHFTLDEKSLPILKPGIEELAGGITSEMLGQTYDVPAVDVMAADAEAKNWTPRVIGLEVVFTDWESRTFPVTFDQGWQVHKTRNVLVIGHGVPRKEIPLGNVRWYDVVDL
jgi:hypothetical protein